MLLIKTFLDRSRIHGIGLFASQDLKAGIPVWEFNDLVDLKYTLEEWDYYKRSITSQSFSNLLRLSYKEEGYIFLCIDNAQFINHSSTRCNIGHKGHSRNKMYAVRNILKGEELLCNYHAYSDPDDYHAKILND